MTRIVKISVLALLVLAFSLGAFTPARAGRPWCNIDKQTERMFQGNLFTVTWSGSPNVDRAFVVWPLDDRDHWAAYELWLTDESFDKTGLHEGSVFLTGLPESRWKAGQLIVILTDNSPQPRHHPTQEPPMDHGRLLVLLGLVAPRGGEVPPEGAPLCKIYLDPVRVEPIP